MGKKYGTLIICAAILVSCFTGTASAETWYVDDDGGADFINIQDAINNATDGDTVIVRDGHYIENIKVNKTLTIQSENGSNKTFVTAEDSEDDAFKVTANYVNISGFKVENARGPPFCAYWFSWDKDLGNDGERLKRCIFHTFRIDWAENAEIRKSDDGKIIRIFKGENSANIIINEKEEKATLKINDGRTHDLRLIKQIDKLYICFPSEFDERHFLSSKLYDKVLHSKLYEEVLSGIGAGIYLFSADYCNISNNTCSNNRIGILLESSNQNNLSNNICSNNYKGILLSNSNKSGIASNTCSNNIAGISLFDSNKNIIVTNTCSNNIAGIPLSYHSNLNSISKNICSDNRGHGIDPECSFNNIIYLNNLINNTERVPFGFINRWHSIEKITYIYNDNTYTNILGNYWSDYTGTDNNKDGIGDYSYRHDPRGDNNPLMVRFENYYPAPTPTPTPIPSFEFLFAIIGILAAICLIRRRGQVY